MQLQSESDNKTGGSLISSYCSNKGGGGGGVESERLIMKWTTDRWVNSFLVTQAKDLAP